MRPNTPMPWQAIPCTICNQPILTNQTTATHPTCMAKPNPCQCGKPSMPYPNCAHCKGTGTWHKQTCPHCPPGPCIECCAKQLIARCKQERDN